MAKTAEVVKRNPKDFGGFQSARLPAEQISLRSCCAKYCDSPGKVQVPVPGGYRIICGRHAVICFMMTLGILGDPSPVPEVRQYADQLEVDWAVLLSSDAKHPTMPEHFSCLRCGGGFLVETAGMYAGKRYIHTCGG